MNSQEQDTQHQEQGHGPLFENDPNQELKKQSGHEAPQLAVQTDPHRGARDIKVGGPPGTGKTTWLISEVLRSIDHGIQIEEEDYPVNPEMITIVTFTRAAAGTVRDRIEALRKLNSRDRHEELGDIRVGTLHSIAIQELAREGMSIKLVRSGSSLGRWNALYPDWKLSAQEAGEEGVPSTDADRIMNRIDRLRSRMIPQQEWERELDSDGGDANSAECMQLWKAYQQHKQDEEAIDFTDVAELASTAPISGMLMLVDEAQDFSPLEWKALHQWSYGFARRCWIGDDDQSIYQGLKGADPESFARFKPDHEGKEIILEQSWRVPKRVQALAMRITAGIHPSERWHKAYLPRDEDGQIALSEATWEDPTPLLPILQEVTRRGEQGLGGEVMILAHARRMLEPALKMMREEWIPFHNPYTYNGSWTPVADLSGSGRAGARERVLAFLKTEPRSNWELYQATHALAGKGTWRRGLGAKAREALSLSSKGTFAHDPVSDDLLAQIDEAMEDEMKQALASQDLEWLENHLSAAARKSTSWPTALGLATRGRLAMKPRVIPGTIHSVKGAEADHVILIPDLGGGHRKLDGEALRMMYVGATRARHGLILCQATSDHALPVAALIGA